MPQKITMTTPLVELDGDEMTRVLWPLVKEKLILPFVDLKTEYYDLGIEERDRTDDQVTIDAAGNHAIRSRGQERHHHPQRRPGQGIWPEEAVEITQRHHQGHARRYRFRKPIMVNNIRPAVRSWEKPIVVGRHAYGDVYKNAEIFAEHGGKLEIVVTARDGKVTRETVMDVEGPAILQGVHNTVASIESFARACFEYALDQQIDCWFATKDTISKIYDQRFKDIFQEIFAAEYRGTGFTAAGDRVLSTP